MYGGYMPQNQFYVPPAQRYEVIKVSGRNGAEAFQMAPNSSVILLDTNDALIWLKTTDGAGYPTLTPYSIAPYTPEPAINTNDLEARIKRLEDIINESYHAKTAKQSNEQRSGNGKQSQEIGDKS